MLRRGFWLYVWEITTPNGEKVLYVGRTGDSSSPNAQSLFHRMGQNLGTLSTSSMVRNNLRKRGFDPVECKFRMVGHGPVFEEAAKTMDAHKPIRDQVAAVEKRLAEDLEAAGYDVMNTVPSRAVLDEALYERVRPRSCRDCSRQRRPPSPPRVALRRRSQGACWPRHQAPCRRPEAELVARVGRSAPQRSAALTREDQRLRWTGSCCSLREGGREPPHQAGLSHGLRGQGAPGRRQQRRPTKLRARRRG